MTEMIEKDFCENKKIELPKMQRDYMITIGAYTFKLSNIHFIRIDPLNPKDESYKEFIESGHSFQILVYTDHGKFLAALSSRENAEAVLQNVCDKINELIATQKEA